MPHFGDESDIRLANPRYVEDVLTVRALQCGAKLIEAAAWASHYRVCATTCSGIRCCYSKVHFLMAQTEKAPAVSGQELLWEPDESPNGYLVLPTAPVAAVAEDACPETDACTGWAATAGGFATAFEISMLPLK